MKALSVSPVFHVSDLERSIGFYKDVLGFAEDFRFESYVGLKHGDVALHITVGGSGDYRRPIGGGTVYIFCDSVDSFYESITSRGARPSSAPSDTAYGMRDFVVHDPDGNQVSFGAEKSE
jgi:catechol 2,3-dioxygenase-like lactoylglutathione lyase family enzyme